MESLITIVSLWLHTLATVLMLGHYLLLGLVYVPFFEQQTGGAPAAAALEKISARFMPWVLASFVVFIASGGYLMLVDPYYPGFGNIFANAWTILMSVKHLLVLALIGLGAWLNLALRRAASGAAGAGSLGTVKFILNTFNAGGALVLLLTTIAQAQ
jgi:uncharacterized membrane protein